MVKALHAAGIEVILDVVYNHTAEGNHMGPMLSMRGIDNLAYYRVTDDDPRYYLDFTGTGNSLNMRHPHVLQLIMDSLRYWVTEMHVDGFRFDLASTLARELFAVDRLSAFFDLVQQDPVVSQVKLIAEPWDVGEGGYQVGNFPPLWSEWNGRYRDTIRDFWRGEPATLAEFGYRFTGSSDLYEADTRRPTASINFVTAHDGFTLRDLVSYNEKHNEANGEDNRDGESHNRSWNCGVEGETDDEEVVALRARQRRNLVTTLLLSQGVPMILGGDELGRTQGGNNNAYCQDNELSWFDWGDVDTDFRTWCEQRRHAAPQPPGVPPPPLVPGPADPRHRGPRLVPSRRRGDERRRLGERLRPRRRRVPQRRRHPHHGRLWWPDRRRLLLRHVQRQRDRPRLDGARAASGRATGSSSWTPTSPTNRAPTVAGRIDVLDLVARSMLVLRSPAPERDSVPATQPSMAARSSDVLHGLSDSPPAQRPSSSASRRPTGTSRAGYHDTPEHTLRAVVDVLEADADAAATRRAGHRRPPGTSSVGRSTDAELALADGTAIDCSPTARRSTCPPDLPVGCHQPCVLGDGETSTLVVAPPAMPRAAELAGGAGLFVPTYALWEHAAPLPSFAHLAALAAAAHRTRARRRVHAAAVRRRSSTSRSTRARTRRSSRLHWNEVYLDDAALPAAADADVRRRSSTGASSPGAAAGSCSTRRPTSIRTSRPASTASSPAVPTSPTTPASAPAPATRPTPVARAALVERSHLLAQYLADRQLAAVEGPGRAALALDLPIGSHPDGYETWAHADAVRRRDDGRRAARRVLRRRPELGLPAAAAGRRPAQRARAVARPRRPRRRARLACCASTT